MNQLSAARLSRLWTILIPMTIFAGCGDGDGPTRIVNEPAAPYDGPPAACFESLSFEDVCDFSYSFEEFEGGPGTIVTIAGEPLIAGDSGNTTDKAIKAVKARATSGAVFGGFVVTVLSTPPAPFDIAAGDSFTIKVWSQRPVPVLFEPKDGGPGSGAEVQHGGTGWEELTFVWDNFSGTIDGFVFIFDNGTNGNFAADPDNWTFYIDDITPVEGVGPAPATFPVTFDEDPTPAVTEFGGAGYAFEPGPAGGGDGDTLKIVRDGGEAFAGAWVAVAEIPNDAGPQTISAEVYSPTAGIRMVAKAEYADNDGSGEVEANEVVVAGWQTLTWTFTNLAPGNVYNRFTILPNLGTVDDPAQSYYFDNINLVDSGGGGFTAITFDDPAVTYTLTGFGGAEDSSLQPDPTDGTNTVVRVNRAAGAEVFAGTTVSTGPNNSVPTIPLDAANTQMTVRVYSPAAGIPVRLKIEDASDPTVSVETEATTTVANAWETLTFNFLNEVPGTAAFDPTATYDKVTIFFNFGAAGAPAETYYFDDIDVLAGTGGGGGGGFTAITFDDPAVTYTLTGFGGAEDSSLQPDPTDGTNTVVRVNRAAGAEVFAGTTVSTGPNNSVPTIPLDAANTQMTVRVYSPAAGIPVRLKVEDASDPTVSVETEATTTVANAWETLTFNFLNEVPGTAAFDPTATYDKVTIFFNFGAAGAPAETYYFDDIDVLAGTGGASFSSIDFDDPAVTYTLTGFGGAEDSSLQPDPTDGTNTVVRVNRAAGAEVFAGTTVSTGPNNSVPTIPLDAANTQMTVRVYSPAAGIPVRLKIEDASDPTVSVETEATTTVANAWETLTFNFLNEVPGTAAFDPTATYDKVTIFFNFGAAGAPAETYYFDDIDVLAGTGGGGGGGVSFSTITFDDPGATYTLTDFGDNSSTVTNDPAGGTNMVVQAVKLASAQVWAGTTVSTLPNDEVPVIPLDASNTQMTVRVYSPDAGIPVRLKIEDASDNTISVETEAVTTVVNTWETLTFDFANEAAGTAPFNEANTYNRISIFFNFGTDGATAGEKTYFFDDIAVGAGGGLAQVDLPVTFDDAGVDYDLVDFGDTVSTLVADPTDGANTVASTIKPVTAPVWAGTTVGGTNGLASAIPFTATETSMTVRVYSPDAGIPVRLKVEDASDNTISVETEAVTTVVNTWETLTFDFSNEAAGTAALNLANTYDKASIFFNFGTDGATAGEKTYLWDDVEFVTGGGGPAQVDLPVTFDDAGVDYDLVDFGDTVSTLVADPTDGANTVASTIKPVTAPVWAGTTVGGTNGLASAIPFTATETSMTVRVYSPDAGIPVRLKVEDASDPTVSVETEGTTTVANAWETLTFDFSNEAAGTAALNLANTYDKASIFFNFGTDGATAGEKTYLWDDVQFVAGGGGAFSAIDFDDPAVTYTLTGFGGAEDSSLQPDPTDGTNTVVRVNRAAGAEVFAGTTVSTGPNNSVPTIPLDAANTQMTVRVYSPAAGIPVRLKIEDASDPTVSVETEATTTVANAWETLTFNFLNEVPGTAAFDPTATYDKVTIFFNFGAAGAPAETYYFDDIDVLAGTGGGGGGGVSFSTITFDDPGTTYTLTDFGDNSSTVTNDPAGGTNMVVQAVKLASAQVWAGTTVSTLPNDEVPVIPLDASNTQMTVRVYSPDAGIPVRLKIEDASDNTISVETEAVTTVVNTWETLTFDFANEAAGTAPFNEANTYNRISIFFNFGTDGATAGEKTYFFDDIAVGAGGGLAQVDLPVTFDDAGVDYDLVDFGDTVSTLVADPTDGANTVASTIKPVTAPVWAGTTVGGTNGLASAIPFTATETSMTVRVYSPDAGIPVRLKVEDASDNTISVETEAVTTVVNTWETLTFDFSNEAAGTAALNLANTYDKASIFFNFGTDGATAGEKTYLWDDIEFVTGSGGGSGNFVNGDFETGDFTGWTQFQDPPGSGSIALDSSGQGGRGGTVARLVAAGSDVVGTNDVIIGQVGLAAGTITPGDSIDVSFDLYGSLTGAGGVVFVEVIFLDGSGSDDGRDFVGPASPYTPTGTWTTHSDTVIAGTTTGGGSASVAGGVTLELKVACGAIVGGCGVDASFDNVTFTIN